MFAGTPKEGVKLFSDLFFFRCGEKCISESNWGIVQNNIVSVAIVCSVGGKQLDRAAERPAFHCDLRAMHRGKLRQC